MFSPRVTRSRHAYKQYESQKRSLADVKNTIEEMGPHKKKVKTQVLPTKENAAHAQHMTISEEEKSMAGAPQGTLVHVEVLPSEALKAVTDPTAELFSVLSTVDSEEWDVAYNAIVTTRRLFIYHSALVTEDVVSQILGSVQTAVGSLRSTMSRNAMLCLQDFFEHLPAAITESSLNQSAKVLLQRAGSDKKFIADAATQVLMNVAKRAALANLLMVAMNEGVESPNVNVSATAVQVFEQCLGTLGVGKTPAAGCGRINDLNQALVFASKGLRCKKTEGRDMAKKSLRRLLRALGDVAFTNAVNGVFADQQAVAAEVVKNSVVEGKKANDGEGVKLSIRERMLAQKTKQGQQGGSFQMCM